MRGTHNTVNRGTMRDREICIMNSNSTMNSNTMNNTHRSSMGSKCMTTKSRIKIRSMRIIRALKDRGKTWVSNGLNSRTCQYSSSL